MRKGTFSVQNATPRSSDHNSRKNAPKYLIDESKNNFYVCFENDKDFIEKAKIKYKLTHKQKMQEKQVKALIKETVLTIKKDQDEKDIYKLFEALNKEYGGHHLTELSIHRDEGYFKKDNIAYYPTKNILKKGDDWYVCSDKEIDKPTKLDFDKKVDIKSFEKVYNYHAHAKFSMFDLNTGATARMDRGMMSKRIKFVSDKLGLAYDPQPNTRKVSKSVNLIKDEHLSRARQKERDLVSQQTLKNEIAKLREELRQAKATRPDYALLEEKNKKLKQEVKHQNLINSKLQDELSEMRERFSFNNLDEIPEYDKDEAQRVRKPEELDELESYNTKKFFLSKVVDFKAIAEHQAERLKELYNGFKALTRIIWQQENFIRGVKAENKELSEQVRKRVRQIEKLKVELREKDAFIEQKTANTSVLSKKTMSDSLKASQIDLNAFDDHTKIFYEVELDKFSIIKTLGAKFDKKNLAWYSSKKEAPKFLKFFKVNKNLTSKKFQISEEKNLGRGM